MLDGPMRKTICYAASIKFQKKKGGGEGVAHASIRLYKFSANQMFKIKLPTLILLRKQ